MTIFVVNLCSLLVIVYQLISKNLIQIIIQTFDYLIDNYVEIDNFVGQMHESNCCSD